MARAGAKRFGHHAHPERWLGAWLARSHHFIRMNSISTGAPLDAGILLTVTSPHGGRASGGLGLAPDQPAMALHNKRRQAA